MASKSANFLVCNCEKTMSLDADVLAKALGVDSLPIHSHLCRSGLKSFEKALENPEDLVVACTQEAPLFCEIAEEAEHQGNLRFVNIRENAGWCKHKGNANAKIAALLNMATYEARPAPLKSIKSDGLCLVYGAGQAALDMARLLSGKLSVTLVLTGTEDLVLPDVLDVPIFKGQIKHVGGSLGSFELELNHYAALLPSSRGSLQFAMERDGARSQCSLIFDMSGGTPLVTGHNKRDGYYKADPGDPSGMLKLAYEISEMVGEFEKPIYVRYNGDICAHSRSQISGCSKCLDLCPAGAIQEAGDGVAFDSGICGGCGSCHAACPTGAVSYAYPDRNDQIAKTQLLLRSYQQAGGKRPVLLVHGIEKGTALIGAMARFGDGLPVNFLPMPVHSIASTGHVELVSYVASGASQIVLLGEPQNQEEYEGLEREVALAKSILSALGFDGDDRISLVVEQDPDIVAERFAALEAFDGHKAQTFEPVGSKRDVARSAFAALKAASASTQEMFDLPQLAPYGVVNIDIEKCTLCMACVSACPAEAMIDTPGEPRLRFIESACIQCGLCANTCPENALELQPRLNLRSDAMQPVTMKEEEPFCCVECGTAFATKSTIARISEQLAGKHAMYGNAEMSRLIEMCDNCRIEAQANSANDPFASGSRPRVRTTQDYLDAQDAGLSVEDFLIKD